MITPGMINLAGTTARKYSHINGYAEGSDGAVFVAACISEAFFEKDPAKIVRQAAQLIDPRSNYRKALDFVLTNYEKGKPWQQIAAASEANWRPEYPQLNNSVAAGALVTLGFSLRRLLSEAHHYRHSARRLHRYGLQRRECVIGRRGDGGFQGDSRPVSRTPAQPRLWRPHGATEAWVHDR